MKLLKNIVIEFEKGIKYPQNGGPSKCHKILRNISRPREFPFNYGTFIRQRFGSFFQQSHGNDQ
jgi:hypothetical protein